MRKIKIISVAAILALAYAVLAPTASSFALDDADHQGSAGSQNPVSASSDYQSLQTLLGQVYLIPDYTANSELSALINRAEALSESSDPAEIALVLEQLTSVVASIPASTAYDVDPASDGSGSGGSGDPADVFEDKHEPTNPQSSPNSSQTTSQDPQVSTSSSNKRSNSGAVPNTGVADHAAAANAVASSTIFTVAGVLATLGFCLYHHHTAKK